MTRTPMAGASGPPCSFEARHSVESAADSTYSWTRKSSPSASTTSMTGTTFGCRTSDATRASSRSMSEKSWFESRCGCTRFTTTSRSNPT